MKTSIPLKQLSFLFLISLFVFSSPSWAKDENGKTYSAKVGEGQSPLAKKTKVKIQRQGEKYVFWNYDEKKHNQTWELGLNQMRGAHEGSRGVWVYWYGPQKALQSIYFAMKSGKASLAEEINENLKIYHQRLTPMSDEEAQKYQENFKEYQEKVLKKK